jgi:hypothetical protein
LVFHIRSLSKDRLMQRMGQVDPKELSMAIKTLNDILRY